MTQFIPFQNIPQLAKTDVAYAEAHNNLRPFYKYNVDIESFKQVIVDKKQNNTNRVLLVEVLQKQYHALNTYTAATENIAALIHENTFTVTTAHQPSLLLGPLYFVYKICSVISLSRSLKAHYPAYHFVPTFVIGGEDHDFEEVNNIQLFNKKLIWQNDEKGAVGMMHTQSLHEVLETLKSILGESELATEIFEIITQNYTSHSLYHTATQGLINDLFGRYGLVVVNMNDAKLKRQFIPYFQKELFENPSKKLVGDTQDALQKLGYKAQAFARDINIFYLDNQLRERIVFEENKFKVLNTELSFSHDELQNLLETQPEKFSPNVVLRPLYQEVTLPNLAYIGGGGELAYWLERKSQFEFFNVNFPMLIRRNSVVLIDENSSNKLEKLGLTTADIFQDIDVLIKQYITKNASITINLSQEKAQLQSIYDNIALLGKQIDPTLEKAIVGESVKQLQTLEQLESRIIRAEKQKHETAINQIRNLVQKFCPNGSLQERTDNFLPYYIKYGQHFFENLIEVCNPLQSGFIVLKK